MLLLWWLRVFPERTYRVDQNSQFVKFFGIIDPIMADVVSATLPYALKRRTYALITSQFANEFSVARANFPVQVKTTTSRNANKPRIVAGEQASQRMTLASDKPEEAEGRG